MNVSVLDCFFIEMVYNQQFNDDILTEEVITGPSNVLAYQAV